MAENLYNKNKIARDGWYSEGDLILTFGLSRDTQRKARDAGQLAYIKRNDSYLYRGDWLLNYFEDETVNANELAAEKAARVRRGRRGRSASIARTSGSTSAANCGAVAQFEGEVQKNIQRGMNRAQATRTVALAQPVLHSDYLKAVNSNRPQAAAHSRAIDRSTEVTNFDAVAEFNARVAEKIGQGLNRADATRAIIQSCPRLHRDYLLASNAGRPKAQELINKRFDAA